MHNKSGVNPRNFNPMSVPGLSDEARQAVNAAFDAMSAWRIEMANSNENSSELVIEKMAAAARALGWPSKLHFRDGLQLRAGGDDRPAGNAVEAKVIARRQPRRHLGKRRRFANGGDQSHAVLPTAF
jgi:hypothetical protein